MSYLKAIGSFLVGLSLAGCSISPKPIEPTEQLQLLAEDRLKASVGVDQISTRLPLYEALARGLKHNLDYRSKLMEQAIALGTSSLSNYDMLPKLAANAGYNYRNNYFITYATGAETGNPSLSEPFISSAKDFGIAGLALSWNLLDFGVSYYNAQQNADKVLVASERRRKAMHLLMQDIQVAYIRAASAQELQTSIIKTIQAGSDALAKSKNSQEDGVRNPLDALKYRKSLLDNLKILETITQELSSAMVDLNLLINQPASSTYKLDHPDSLTLPSSFETVNVDEFEIRALIYNADLKESIYNARVAALDTKKSLLKLLPGLNLSVAPQASNNSYYINKTWIEGAAQVSFNLWNILTAPMVKRQAEANEDWIRHKRMTAQMAIISQVHIAKQQIINARQLYNRAVEIDEVDEKIAEIIRAKESEGTASEAERVAADASAIVSRLRKHQALAQLFAATGKLQTVTGSEPDIDSIDNIPLTDLTTLVKTSYEQWLAGELPSLQALKTAKNDESQADSKPTAASSPKKSPTKKKQKSN